MANQSVTFSVIVPICNPGILWREWISAYKHQTVQADRVIIIDSSSTDDSVFLAEEAGFFVKKICKSEFDHGETRNLATSYCGKDTDIIIFLTQDSIMSNPFTLEKIIKSFDDNSVAAAYGRQLPHKDANPLAIHARLFNYSDQSIVKSKDNIEELGIKTIFLSNSFSAYRKRIFEELNGFPTQIILAEDMYFASKIIASNYKIIYCATAQVYHSHNYSLLDEFRRYFDIGVFHNQYAWILKEFKNANNEGIKFVISELSYLWRNYPSWIGKSICSILFKFIGFKLGLKWNKLPRWVIKKISMHKGYWDNEKK